MAKTALLGQNDNLAIENLKQSVGRSVFNLSHSTSFPIDVDGAILPILAMETVPTDSFQISNEVLLRQLSPLKVPIMTNLRLNTAYFYCSNRMAWDKWSRFISGGRSGNETYEIPTMCNKQVIEAGVTTSYLKDTDSDVNIDFKNSLHTYFHVSMNGSSDPDEMPLAFPFFDYQLICRDFYTNIDRIGLNPDTDHFTDFAYPFADWSYNNLFPVNDDEIRLKDGLQLYSGFNSGNDPSITLKGFVLDKVRYHDVRDDYFTVQKTAPMRGNAPQLTGAAGTLTTVLPSGTSLTLRRQNDELINLSSQFMIQGTEGNDNYLYFGNSVGALGQYTRAVVLNRSLSEGNIPTDFNDFRAVNQPVLAQGGVATNQLTTRKFHFQPTGDSTYPFDGKVATLQNEYKTVGDVEFSSSASITLGITAQELRLLSQLTIWQELNMLHKPTYNDFLNAHFENTKVGDSLIEAPQYIGGTSQVISINEILQTSASSETSPLGTQGATAMSLAGNHVGSFFCPDYGWIVGVAFILPELLYNPAMPRSFSRRTKEDYYFPEFANLSMQASLNKELFFSNDSEWNNTPLGYTGAFDEMRSIPNFVAGDFLNSSYEDLKAWVLRREFDNSNKPSLSQTFLSLKNNVDKIAWQVEDMPAFILQCANYIKANRPMPYVAIPKAL